MKQVSTAPMGKKRKKNEAGIQGPDGQGKRLNAGIRGPDGPRNTFSYKKKSRYPWPRWAKEKKNESRYPQPRWASLEEEKEEEKGKTKRIKSR